MGATARLNSMDLAALRALLPEHDVRAVTTADVPSVYDLVQRVNVATLGHVDTSEAELRDDLTGPHFDLALDTVLVLGSDGQALAYGQGHDEHSGIGWIDVYADPHLDREDFDALADAVIDACSERIIASTKQRGASAVKLTAGLYDVETQMREAYERQGFHVETIYRRMALEFAEGITFAEVQLPNGVTISNVDPNSDDIMKQGFELYRDTFSEHHGVSDAEISLESFTTNWKQAESYDPRAWWFAYDNGQPVGMLMGDNRRLEQGEGFIRYLGVRKPERGRGIARALMLTAFEHWREAGRSGVQLGVDTANVTSATQLYESVGMRSSLSALALERTVNL
jgi:GNAT superfamily N-acetyltransferase